MGGSAARLVTVGYEGKSAQQLVAELTKLQVDVLVDVRLTPVSRKAGLSKCGLAGAVEAVGISYVHLPALGNPKDNREAFRSGAPAARSRFRARVRSADGTEAVLKIVTFASSGRVAVLCFERDADACHRKIVVDEARRLDPALQIAHA